MLYTYLMIRTNDRTLKQAPNALDAVSMNISNNPLFSGVIKPLVLSVGIFNSPIGGHFVGIDRFRVRCRVVVNKLVQRCFVSVRNNLQANLSGALDCPDSNGLVALVA